MHNNSKFKISQLELMKNGLEKYTMKTLIPQHYSLTLFISA